MSNGTLVTGLFVDPLDAHRAVSALIDVGFPREEMSVVASGGRDTDEFGIDRRSRVGDGAAIGAGFGGALGALLAGFTGLGTVALGGAPLLIAGPIVAALAGAGAGAATGGVLGGMIGLGIPEDEVNFYKDSLGKGSVLLGVRCEADRERVVRDVMNHYNATRVTAQGVTVETKEAAITLSAEEWGSRSPLHRLFVDQLRDVYYAEHQLEKAIGTMEEHASSPELASALSAHREETRTHITRLESVFRTIAVNPEQKKCPAINGIIVEATELMGLDNAGPMKDAAIICAAQKAEHYEIGTYGCLKTYAQTLSLPEVAEILDQTLSEEWGADKRLTELATSGINSEAAVYAGS